MGKIQERDNKHKKSFDRRGKKQSKKNISKKEFD
jgi:hypothetical protein